MTSTSQDFYKKLKNLSNTFKSPETIAQRNRSSRRLKPLNSKQKRWIENQQNLEKQKVKFEEMATTAKKDTDDRRNCRVFSTIGAN